MLCALMDGLVNENNDLVMIKKPLICCLFGKVVELNSLMMEAALLCKPNTMENTCRVLGLNRKTSSIISECIALHFSWP